MIKIELKQTYQRLEVLFKTQNYIFMRIEVNLTVFSPKPGPTDHQIALFIITPFEMCPRPLRKWIMEISLSLINESPIHFFRSKRFNWDTKKHCSVFTHMLHVYCIVIHTNKHTHTPLFIFVLRVHWSDQHHERTIICESLRLKHTKISSNCWQIDQSFRNFTSNITVC